MQGDNGIGIGIICPVYLTLMLTYDLDTFSGFSPDVLEYTLVHFTLEVVVSSIIGAIGM